MNIQCRNLLVIFVLFFHVTASLFIPTRLECGSERDVKAVTSFPYSIASTKDTTNLVYSKLTWNHPKPTTNSSVIVDGHVVGYVVDTYQYLDEVNGTDTRTIFDSHYVQNLTFDVSTTQLPECAGFYLQTNLSNGANVEYTWYMQYKAIDLDFAGTTYHVAAGQPRVNLYISGFPYSTNVSAPASKFNLQFSSPVAPPSIWEGVVGEPPFEGPNNATTLELPLVPFHHRETTKKGYLVTSASCSHILPYHPAKNGDIPIMMHVRGAAFAISNDLQLWSLDAVDTYVAQLTEADNVESLKLFEYGANVTKVDGDGSSASGLVLPSFQTIFLSTIVLVGLFHL
eukprot:TRINITY_DN1380_c0_g2_i1.p1 TRINITY_DN1380_c0_g2~~TRINITY_DN1380_c0_g2_i1.p1  ORF type:complete len:341 (+),score=37.87 TRINITY_DN1380_c0_g2_i1:251-1273(+)